LFDRVAAFGMQSETYAGHLRALGITADRVEVTGNVKYDGVLLDRDNPKTRDLGRLLDILPGQLVWVAGSTHDPEERIVLSVHGRFRREYSDLRLVLVPRAPERFDEVARLIVAAGEVCVRRSELTPGKAAHSSGVVLIDTLGELSAAWGLATIGFTGGSLNDKRGGQSMIEPAGLAVPVVFGPHTWNFKDAVAGLLEVGGAICVKDEDELEQAVNGLLQDAEVRRRIGDAARAFVLAQQGATGRTLDLLDRVLAARP
jgi:3-deoxy-D-manno-octulosonic-acid transferase